MFAPQKYINMNLDSGASANFHGISHHLHHRPTSTAYPFVSVIVPNGNIMTSQSTTNLPLPELKSSAIISHGFKSLASGFFYPLVRSATTIVPQYSPIRKSTCTRPMILRSQRSSHHYSPALAMVQYNHSTISSSQFQSHHHMR